MKEVIIMSGVSGSGKSTVAKNCATINRPALILSADDYFMLGERYVFDPMKIGEAHKDCFKRYLQALASDEPSIVVDNTNIEPWEIAPYWLAANAMSYLSIRIIEVHASLDWCLAHNQHNVPYGVLRSMHSRFQTRTLPGHWKIEGRFKPSEGPP